MQRCSSIVTWHCHELDADTVADTDLLIIAVNKGIRRVPWHGGVSDGRFWPLQSAKSAHVADIISPVELLVGSKGSWYSLSQVSRRGNLEEED